MVICVVDRVSVDGTTSSLRGPVSVQHREEGGGGGLPCWMNAAFFARFFNLRFVPFFFFAAAVVDVGGLAPPAVPHLIISAAVTLLMVFLHLMLRT